MLKFIAPLNTAIVWLVRKPWGWLRARRACRPGNPGRAGGGPAGAAAGREVDITVPPPPNVLPAPILQAMPLPRRRLWLPARAEKLGSE